MILTIDAGNSRTKWGVFDASHVLIATGVFANTEYPILPPASWANCQLAVVACVAGESVADNIDHLLAKVGVSARFMQASASACGLENGYDNPAQLGIDRWAAMLAAWQQYKAPCVVVNAGTAVTLDVIAMLSSDDGKDPARQARFMGGLILPGLQLMQSSLCDNTAQIKSRSLESTTADLPAFQRLATNTASAVHSGALAANIYLIKAMLSQSQAHASEQILCVLSGGDAAVFKTALDTFPPINLTTVIILEPHLVLKGLHLLHYEYTANT